MTKIEIPARTDEEHALLQRINDGKDTEADRTALRKAMRESQELARVGDLCEMAFDGAALLAGDGNRLWAELVKGRRETIRQELGYADALPAERLLIDEVALCRLRHHHSELRYTQAAKEGMSFAHGEYWEKKLGATQRRYLRAIETLARVGKLLRSVTLQVNIGEKQVNVAGCNVGGAVAGNGLPDPPDGTR